MDNLSIKEFPMKVLIVIAHPEPLSMNHAMSAVIRERFEMHGCNVKVSDLYAEQFKATPSPSDFTHLSNPEVFSLVHEQRHAQLLRSYSHEILMQQNLIAEANLIIFQFPLWWYSVPSILKGWVEKVLSNGFAYDDEHMFENGLLKGKRAVLSITTGANEAELYADRGYTGTIEQFLQPFTGGVLRFCGIDVVDQFIAYAVNRMSQDERQQMFDALRSRVDALVSAHTLTKPINPLELHTNNY